MKAFREVLGSRAVKRPRFDFRGATEDAERFRKTAVAFEDLAVAAYKAQAPLIQSRAYLVAALAIHSVEARHAAWIRRLAGVVPAADAFDEPRSKTRRSRSSPTPTSWLKNALRAASPGSPGESAGSRRAVDASPRRRRAPTPLRRPRRAPPARARRRRRLALAAVVPAVARSCLARLAARRRAPRGPHRAPARRAQGRVRDRRACQALSGIATRRRGPRSDRDAVARARPSRGAAPSGRCARSRPRRRRTSSCRSRGGMRPVGEGASAGAAERDTGWVPRAALGAYGRCAAARSSTSQAAPDAHQGTGARCCGCRSGSARPARRRRGWFVVRNRLTRYKSAFYGPVALGTSARSEALTDWPGGGYVGIHGTDRPDLIPARSRTAASACATRHRQARPRRPDRDAADDLLDLRASVMPSLRPSRTDSTRSSAAIRSLSSFMDPVLARPAVSATLPR